MNKLKDILANIAITVVILIIIAFFMHLFMWGCFRVGIPKDSDELLKISFEIPNISPIIVYGTDYHITYDKYGRKLLVIENPYEATWFGWSNKYLQKSWELESINFVAPLRDEYLLPK